MKLDKERLRVLAEAATGWSNCDKVWPHAEYDGISVLGAICEEGVQYPVAEIDADTYGDDGDSLKLAQFYAGANPAAVLALLSENAALAAEVERTSNNRDMWKAQCAVQAQEFERLSCGHRPACEECKGTTP